MVNKPSYFSSRPLNKLGLIHRERYLPTAFDESLSYVEKLNVMIHYLNEIDELTNEMLEKWNEVYNWVLNQGLDESVRDRLNIMIQNGDFHKIINEEILGDINLKVDDLIEQFEVQKVEFKAYFTELIDEIYSELYNVGITKFEWSDS